MDVQTTTVPGVIMFRDVATKETTEISVGDTLIYIYN
jgi:hypothetical protein